MSDQTEVIALVEYKDRSKVLKAGHDTRGTIAEAEVQSPRSHDAFSPHLPGCMAGYLFYASQHRDVSYTRKPKYSAQKSEDARHADQCRLTLSESAGPSESDFHTARRALKTATWTSAFFLITTDILGPYSTPFAFSQLGYGTGTILFVILAIAAAYSAWILWRLFLRLDSPQYPVSNYGDIVYKIYGRWPRLGCNILQILQLWFNVGVIILSNAQGLSQIAKQKVCFSVLTLIWAIAGMLVGQIKSLQRFGSLANVAVWLNLITLGITMGVVVHSLPNYSAAFAQYGADVVNLSSPAPVSTTVFASGNISKQIVGVMQIVYSYGGAMIFVELLAEMRQPFDFWKALMLAQILILVAYMTFGIFVYHYQGQYVINPGNQGLSLYAWQTATNIISLIAALLAAVLYGNVGLKILYSTLVKDLLRGPEIDTRSGRIWWSLMVPTYWAIAFVIASAVPQFGNISAMVAATCILQFTYTFPPLMMLGFELQQNAIAGDEPFDPATGIARQVDSWRQLSRWRRALGKFWYIKVFNLILGLASASLAGLGMWAAITSINEAFHTTKVSVSFGCKSPV